MRIAFAAAGLMLASVALATLVAAAPTQTVTYVPAVLGYDDARHLLNRTGFGATQAEVERFTGLTRDQAARKLLADTRTAALTPPPAQPHRFRRDPGRSRALCRTHPRSGRAQAAGRHAHCRADRATSVDRGHRSAALSTRG